MLVRDGGSPPSESPLGSGDNLVSHREAREVMIVREGDRGSGTGRANG